MAETQPHPDWNRANIAKAEVLYDVLCNRDWLHYDEYKHNIKARNIANDIADIGPFPSGYMTKDAIYVWAVFGRSNKCGNPTRELTQEHHHGRQNAGKVLLTLFEQNSKITFPQFLEYLHPYCCVVWTTRQENMDLAKLQNSKNALHEDWRTWYARATSGLVKVEKRKFITKQYLKANYHHILEDVRIKNNW